MFLLRCGFWLSVVYASMSWGGVAFRHHGSFEAATRGEPFLIDGGVVDRAVAGVAGLCKGRETDCVRDAAMLTALVQKTLRKDEAEVQDGPEALVDAAAEDMIVQVAAEEPLPVPAPRRRVATRMLTRLP